MIWRCFGVGCDFWCCSRVVVMLVVLMTAVGVGVWSVLLLGLLLFWWVWCFTTCVRLG